MVEKLIDIVHAHEERMVIPLMGFPGIQLNRSTLKQNSFNWSTQFSTLFALQQRFRPDGLFFFMDLSVEASALGLPVRFPLDETPSVENHPIETEDDLRLLVNSDILSDGRVAVYIETMRLMARYLDVLKGGYVIGPFSLTGLLMGASEGAMATVMAPDLLHAVLSFSSGVIGRYARALERAGADAIAILEPTASLLSPEHFQRFAAPYIKEIVNTLDSIPILHICGSTDHLIEAMLQTGAQGLSLGSMVDFSQTIKTIPGDVVLLGNLDPVRVLNGSTPSGVYNATRDLMAAMRPHKNFILSTGCDLPMDTPLENIHAMMDAARGRERGNTTSWSDEADLPELLNSPCDSEPEGH